MEQKRRRAEHRNESRPDATGDVILGTVAYLSPEQVETELGAARRAALSAAMRPGGTVGGGLLKLIERQDEVREKLHELGLSLREE